MDQQQIAGLDPDLDEPFPLGASVVLDRKDGRVVALLEARFLERPAHERGGGGHQDLRQAGVPRGEVDGRLPDDGGVQLLLLRQPQQVAGVSLRVQNVPGRHAPARHRAPEGARRPPQAEDRHPVHLTPPHLRERLAGRRRVRPHVELGHELADVVFAGQVGLAGTPGYEHPPHREQVQEAHGAVDEPDRRDREQVEIVESSFPRHPVDDQVRRRPDQRHGAPEDGRER